MSKNKIVIFCISLFGIIGACTNTNVYDKSQAIDNSQWNFSNTVRFEYICSDTLQPQDISINLRHTGMYKYNNIFLFVTTVSPNGKSIKDTAEFMLAQPSGKWVGSGVGDVLDCRLAYKRQVKFGQQGKYIFYIQHGMRDIILPEILDVGLRIEKSDL